MYNLSYVHKVSLSPGVMSTVDREIFVLKIFCALKFHGAKFS